MPAYQSPMEVNDAGAEAILLRVLDDETGKLNTKPPVHPLRNAVSGALLMDLAFDNRIDTDLHRLTVIDWDLHT